MGRTLTRRTTARPSVRRGRLVALAILVASIVYGWLVPSTAHPTGWEHTFAAAVHVGRHSWLWSLSNLAIEVGSPVAVAAMAAGLVAGLAASGRLRTAVTALAAVACGSAGAEVTKQLVGRRIGVGRALGYPSGHTAGAAAVLMTMVLIVAPDALPAVVRRLAAVVPFLVGAAVGLAMASHGSHYGADIIGGVAFGTCVPLLVLGWPVVARASHEPEADDAPIPDLPVREPVSANRRFGVREEEPSSTPTGELAADIRK